MAGVIETWFRGEGAGVAPARPGGHLHDFGDGLYLTEREDVAWIYAKRRAPKIEDQRVWMVTVERSSLGRVLDLTVDGRWNRFMNEPLLGGKSRLDYLKIKHELYGQFFDEFLHMNKLDIKSFDAVIGPEYNLGGKQLCILHKNGLATRLNLRIKALFRPVTKAARGAGSTGGQSLRGIQTGLPRGSLKIRVLKGVGGVVAGIGVSVLLAYLNYKIMGKLYDSIIEKQTKALEPDVQASVDRQRRRIYELLASGSKAYVTVNIKVSYYLSLDIDPEGGGWDQSVPGVELVWVDIKSYKVEGPGKETEERSFGQRYISQPYTFSSEVTLPQEEIDSYIAAMQEVEWYEEVLRKPALIDSDVERLTQEKKTFEEMVRQSYGDKINTDFSYEEFFPP